MVALMVQCPRMRTTGCDLVNVVSLTEAPGVVTDNTHEMKSGSSPDATNSPILAPLSAAISNGVPVAGKVLVGAMILVKAMARCSGGGRCHYIPPDPRVRQIASASTLPAPSAGVQPLELDHPHPRVGGPTAGAVERFPQV